MADEVRIFFEDDALIAAYPVLEGRHQRRVAPKHRRAPVVGRGRQSDAPLVVGRTGDLVPQRSHDFYDAVARRLAQESRV